MKNIIYPFEECPSFPICSCNQCPLDPEIDIGNWVEGDEECRAEKPTRKKLGEKYANLLPYKGLTYREYNNKRKWDSKTPHQRQQILTRLEKARENKENRASKTIY